MLLGYEGFHWPVSLNEGSGRSYRKRDVGYIRPRSAKKVREIFLFILTNDPISGDRR